MIFKEKYGSTTDYWIMGIFERKGQSCEWLLDYGRYSTEKWRFMKVFVCWRYLKEKYGIMQDYWIMDDIWRKTNNYEGLLNYGGYPEEQ